jgi:hypothetical protein
MKSTHQVKYKILPYVCNIRVDVDDNEEVERCYHRNNRYRTSLRMNYFKIDFDFIITDAISTCRLSFLVIYACLMNRGAICD